MDNYFLDIKYLGKPLPVRSETLYLKLLVTLKHLLEEHGEQWVRDSRDRLLAEAEMIDFEDCGDYEDRREIRNLKRQLNYKSKKSRK